MDFVSYPRSAEGMTRWKRIVLKSSAVVMEEKGLD